MQSQPFHADSDLTFTWAGWFTADNVMNNDTALKELGKIMDPNGKCWNPIQRRVQYVGC